MTTKPRLYELQCGHSRYSMPVTGIYLWCHECGDISAIGKAFTATAEILEADWDWYSSNTSDGLVRGRCGVCGYIAHDRRYSRLATIMEAHHLQTHTPRGQVTKLQQFPENPDATPPF